MRKLFGMYLIFAICTLISGCGITNAEARLSESNADNVIAEESVYTEEMNLYLERRMQVTEEANTASDKAEKIVYEHDTIGNALQNDNIGETRYQYITGDNVQYQFDSDGRLVDYNKLEEQGTYNGELLEDVSAAINVFKAVYADVIPSIDEFEELWSYECEAFYEIGLKYEHYPFYDGILVQIGKNGEVLYFHIYYDGLEEVSEEQEQLFEQRVDAYIQEAQPDCISYEKEVSYRIIDGQLCAGYTIIYEYEGGKQFTESVMFVEEQAMNMDNESEWNE